ncbi:MAG: WxcM-like domain-containing protein [Desulfobacterales bacterium]|jgi:dTDP-4-dehydrorhamnose 3,5-epimerase|nr:WxcM-like domain-containing protein [Desulfobacterales bacterium]
MDIKYIKGGLHVDKRGVISFINDFDFKGVERFYTIRAHGFGKIRGWVGHRREHKWFTALSGSIIIAVVRPDGWETPSHNLEVKQFVLSSIAPGVLHVPPGHATASVMLSTDAHLGIFSSGKYEDAANDDYRFDVNMWKVNL